MACCLPFRVLRRLPFRIDRTIQNIWGPSEHLPLLRDRIRQSRKIDPLIVGEIAGAKRPVLIDGLTRLTVQHELRGEGIDVPYAVEHRQYKSYADAVEDVIAIQRTRRNISEGQIALALLTAERARYGAVPLRGRGRPKKAGAPSFPSAKMLAKRAGVGDRAIRTVSRAMNINPVLVDSIRDGSISLRTAERRLKSQSRDELRTAQRRATASRRKIIEGLPAERGPEAVTADGIYCGDAVAMMQRIEAGTISLIATSIPYPCSMEYDARPAFDGDYSAYLDELRGFIGESKRVLRTGGRLAINFDICSVGRKQLVDRPDSIDNLYNLWADLSWIAQRENGLLFFDWKSWFKQNCAGGFQAKGSVGSCRSPRGNFNVEPILVWAKDSTTLDGDPDDDDIGSEYDKFCVSDWYIRPTTRKPAEHPDFHPCPYPEELAYRLVKLYCYRGDVVLDPFVGSGTTCYVARALGRRFIGIDNSPLYCESARRRVATLDGLTPEQMQRQIERFVPAAGERADGRENHIKRLGA